MEKFNEFCSYLSKITTIETRYIILIFSTFLTLLFFGIIKRIGLVLIKRRQTSDKKVFYLNQNYQIILNVLEILVIFLIFSDYIENLMTLISVLSAAITISLREVILNFFTGVYIRVKKPFKVEDRIEIDGVKGDVINISTFDFEIIEISTKEEICLE